MKRLVVLLGLGLLGASGCKQTLNLGDDYQEKESCTGECVQVPSLGWEGPVLLWVGEPDAAAECPERAPNVVYEGNNGLSAIPQCPTCSCGPSACVLTGLIADSGNMCTGGDLTDYLPPDGWSGACVSSDAVPAANFDSIHFPPLSEAPCEPQTGDVTTQARYDWARFARACKAADPITNTTCPETAICVPTSEPPPPGFSQCVFTRGEDFDCPPGYSHREVFYRDIDTTTVGCTECTCGPPEGGTCLASVGAYADTACSVSIGSITVGLIGGGCADPMAGFDLQAMDATWMQSQPGACTPAGGEPVGEAMPSTPATFCCQVK